MSKANMKQHILDCMEKDDVIIGLLYAFLLWWRGNGM